MSQIQLYSPTIGCKQQKTVFQPPPAWDYLTPLLDSCIILYSFFLCSSFADPQELILQILIPVLVVIPILPRGVLLFGSDYTYITYKT